MRLQIVKKSILALSVIFTGFIAQAAPTSNPQIRVCRLTNGLFHAVNVPDDQIGFCSYGQALLDAPSLMQNAYEGQESLAVQALNKTLTSGYPNCLSAKAQLVQAEDLEGVPYQLCKFADDSFVAQKTLQAGLMSQQNAGLKAALKMKF